MSEKKTTHPLPQSGGNFVRQADGSLKPEGASKAPKKSGEKASKPTGKDK